MITKVRIRNANSDYDTCFIISEVNSFGYLKFSKAEVNVFCSTFPLNTAIMRAPSTHGPNCFGLRRTSSYLCITSFKPAEFLGSSKMTYTIPGTTNSNLFFVDHCSDAFLSNYRHNSFNHFVTWAKTKDSTWYS